MGWHAIFGFQTVLFELAEVVAHIYTLHFEMPCRFSDCLPSLCFAFRVPLTPSALTGIKPLGHFDILHLILILV
jgi:hypothetical protein